MAAVQKQHGPIMISPNSLFPVTDRHTPPSPASFPSLCGSLTRATCTQNRGGRPSSSPSFRLSASALEKRPARPVTTMRTPLRWPACTVEFRLFTSCRSLYPVRVLSAAATQLAACAQPPAHARSRLPRPLVFTLVSTDRPFRRKTIPAYPANLSPHIRSHSSQPLVSATVQKLSTARPE